MVEESRSLRVQGHCRGLKVVKLCSFGALPIYLIRADTNVEYNVLLSHNAQQCDRRKDRLTDDSTMPLANSATCSTISKTTSKGKCIENQKLRTKLIPVPMESAMHDVHAYNSATDLVVDNN